MSRKRRDGEESEGVGMSDSDILICDDDVIALTKCSEYGDCRYVCMVVVRGVQEQGKATRDPRGLVA